MWNIRTSVPEDIPAQRQLWKLAFGDEDAYIDNFYQTYYRPERVLVLFDDISLAPGRIRVRPSGSAGGHNGIKSIISVLHSDEFPRVKIGVGEKPSPEYDLADWVLGQIPKAQQALIGTALQHAAEAALCIVESGCQRAAAEFNGL